MEKKTQQSNSKPVNIAVSRRIDGFAAPQKNLTKVAPKPTPTPRKSAPSSRQINHAARHAPQHAKTLVRRTVKQPASGLKKQLHVQGTVAHTTAQSIPVKHTAIHVDATRLHRAEAAEKHAQVSRFHAPAAVPVTSAPVPVRHAPVAPVAPQAEPPIAHHNNSADMFENAIANATHYVDIAERKVHFKKKARRHALGMTTGVFALMLLGGFMTYQNTPTLQIKVASSVAGVSTRVPDFASAGFTYEGVSNNGIKLVYGFKNDLARYQLVEQTTNWTGEQMISSVSSVAANGLPNYTELQVGDQTVYKFNDRHATWVSNGIWYQIHGDQPLSDAQFAALVRNT
jgi:hypothetical protein